MTTRHQLPGLLSNPTCMSPASRPVPYSLDRPGHVAAGASADLLGGHVQEAPPPPGMEMGVPHTFHATAAPPEGYPAFPQPVGTHTVQGYLATPTPAARQQPADGIPVDVPMYTATIK